MSTQVTLNISNITNNGIPCKSPVVLILGTTGEIAFPCGDKIDKDGNIKLTLPTSEFANNCIKAIVKCSECGHCPEDEIDICLCETGADCPSCQSCIEGVCITRCKDGEFCKDNTCVECDENNPCPLGFICINGTCVCLGKVNEKGECVDCLGDGDCSNCESCQNNQCVEKVCPNNLVCISGDCSCPPGTKYDIATNSCIPIGCENDGQCGECHTCIAGRCTEVICPEGYICQGGECIYWPCTDTTCNNGADCGENCGCLNGQCIPCYLLECTGECAEALGCKCNTNTDKCEPVDNCGDYCDGSTPCLDQNCTCYNNTCVSCENFPCIEGDGGCDSYYNCGCTNGDCGGGNGCNDRLELKKIENCNTECALEATFNTENNCGCDPIEFRVKNVKNCNVNDPRPTEVVLNLEVKAYKNGRPYENYIDEITIGDDELMSATLLTTVRFFTKNASGAWVSETVNAKQVDSVSALSNYFSNIIIDKGHLGFSGILQPPLNRKAEIEVRVSGVDIENNNCRNYAGKVIANYTLDFTSAQITCNQVEAAKAEQKTILTDNDSIRRPLFIWSKSNTGTFSPDKYNPTTSYNKSGWFRKEYGQKVGNVWTDKVQTPADGLWNNLNYKVTVDCGCKSNAANLEKVVFCCPKDWESLYTISNCGRTILVKPFETCLVNRKLEGTLPKEVQTFYYMILNGTDYLLRTGGGHLLSNYEVKLDDPITTVSFEQRYEGTPLVPKACTVDYTETPDVPDFDVEVECGKVVVKKQNGTVGISAVSFVGAPFTANFVASNSNNTWTAIIPKETYTLNVKTTFVGSCVFTKEIQTTCQPVIDATPTKIVAEGECPNGTNPDVLVKVVSGFSPAAEFFNPKDNTWSTGTVVNGVLQKTFTNFSAGDWIFKVKEGAKIAEATVKIFSTIKPTIVTTNICGTNAGIIKIVGGKAGSTWKITGPAFTSGVTVQLSQEGESTTSIPSDKEGDYVITFVVDQTGFTCPQVLTTKIIKDGGVINPIIITSEDTKCQGQYIQFKINDGDKNLTYNVTSNGGIIEDLNGNPILSVQANQNGPFNARVKLNSAGTVTITVSQIVNNNGCYTLNPVSKNLTSTAGPMIVESSAYCGDTSGTFTGYVVVQGTVTSVTIAGVVATPDNFGGWWVYNVPFTEFELSQPAIVSNGSCTDTTQITMPDCTVGNFCPQPPQVVNIVTNPEMPTCGIQNVSVLYNNSSLGVIEGEVYSWYRVVGNTDILLSTGTIDSATLLPNVSGVPNLIISSSNQEETYKLRITTKDICSFDSDGVVVVAGSNLAPVITGQITGVQTGQSYNYFVQNIPGASYAWTLTNSAVTNQAIGDGTANVTISTFVQGNNTISVTVTDGNCTGSATLSVNVNLNCGKNVVVEPVGGAGSTNCKNLTGYANINPNSSAYISHRWLIDNVVVASGGAGIVNLDTSTIAAGDTVQVVLEITFADGCVQASLPYNYIRCNCICDQNEVCTTSFLHSGSNNFGTYDVGTFPSGKTFTIEMNDNGIADRFKVIYDGNLLVDTGYIGNGGHACAIANSLPYYNTTGVPNNTNINAGIISGGGSVAPGINVIRKPAQQVFTFTTATEGVLTLQHNDAQCAAQQSWSFIVNC
jgi:hypothetical protein